MSLKSLWKVSSQNEDFIKKDRDNYRLKHGMLANIPLICRSVRCPFKDTCRVPQEQRVDGERCLTEIAAIMQRFEDLCKHFDIDVSGDYIETKDVVDVSLIKDIVDMEVQILRAESLIATTGDFMAEKVSQVDRQCNAYYEDVIHPSLEYKMKLIEQRNKIYGKLNATRKDKLSILNGKGSYTEQALELIEKVKSKVGNINLDEVE